MSDQPTQPENKPVTHPYQDRLHEIASDAAYWAGQAKPHVKAAGKDVGYWSLQGLKNLPEFLKYPGVGFGITILALVGWTYSDEIKQAVVDFWTPIQAAAVKGISVVPVVLGVAAATYVGCRVYNKKNEAALKEVVAAAAETLTPDTRFRLTSRAFRAKGLEAQDAGDTTKAAYHFLRAHAADPKNRRARLSLWAFEQMHPKTVAEQRKLLPIVQDEQDPTRTHRNHKYYWQLEALYLEQRLQGKKKSTTPVQAPPPADKEERRLSQADAGARRGPSAPPPERTYQEPWNRNQPSTRLPTQPVPPAQSPAAPSEDSYLGLSRQGRRAVRRSQDGTVLVTQAYKHTAQEEVVPSKADRVAEQHPRYEPGTFKGLSGFTGPTDVSYAYVPPKKPEEPPQEQDNSRMAQQIREYVKRSREPAP